MLVMKLHGLKIKKEFALAKLAMLKPFEIRKNDRGFEVGDFVKYSCPEDPELDEKLSKKLFIILYVTDYEQKDGYVVFSDVEFDLSEEKDIKSI